MKESIIKYFKLLIEYDESISENRTTEQLKVEFNQYFNDNLVNLELKSCLGSIFSMMMYASIPVLLFISVVFLPNLRQVFLNYHSVILVCFFVIIVVLVIRKANNNKKHINENESFTDFFTNFKIIPEDLINENLLKAIGDDKSNALFYLGKYKNVEVLFHILLKRNNPNTISVMDQNYSYQLRIYMDKDSVMPFAGKVLSSASFNNLFTYKMSNETFCLISKQEVPDKFTRRTLFRSGGSLENTYIPFLNKDVCLMIFNMMINVFNFIDQVERLKKVSE